MEIGTEIVQTSKKAHNINVYKVTKQASFWDCR